MSQNVIEIRNDPICTPAAKACPECVFRRDSKPGAMGGSPIDTYVGQIVGPFVIPCHMHYKGRTMVEVREEAFDIPQCAGAAIFRANIGVDRLLPECIERKEPDRVLVFASLAEFVAHHLQCGLYRATAWLAVNPPMKLLREQLSKASARRAIVGKDMP